MRKQKLKPFLNCYDREILSAIRCFTSRDVKKIASCAMYTTTDTRRFIYAFASVSLLVWCLCGSTVDALMPSNTKTSAETDKQMSHIAKKIAEFKEDFVVGGMDFDPSGEQIAINPMIEGTDVHIREWRQDGRLLHALSKEAAPGAGKAISYSPNGNLLAAGNDPDMKGTQYRTVRVWDTRTLRVIRDLGDAQGANGNWNDIAFTPNGKEMVRLADRLGGPGDYVIVQNTETWEKVWGISTLPTLSHLLALNSTGTLVVTAGIEYEKTATGEVQINNAVIIDIAARQILKKLNLGYLSSNDIQSIAWSADSKMFFIGLMVNKIDSNRAAVRAYDAASGAILEEETAVDSARVSSIVISSDGRYIAEGNIDGNVRIWDGQHKKLLQSIPVNPRFFTAMCVTKDNHFLAIADAEVVSIWEIN